MVRYIRAGLILLACLFCVGRASAAGGSCPSGANYLNSSTTSQVTLSSLGVTSCFYIAANGSDSNSGTSESSPWLHAPAMANCTGTCASTTPASGEGFIFRGGDTWHFGASTTPSVGSTWDWGAQGWDGTSTHPIYIGVDPTWFSGSSWARPVLSADNPTSLSPVSSCAHKVGNSNVLVSMANISWLMFDDFEMTGLCQNDTGAPFANDIYLEESAASNNVYERLYIHGWTALPFSCSNGTGHCFNLFAFLGSNNDGDIHLQDIVDGSDSVPSSLGVMFGGGYEIVQCVFRYASQIVTTDSFILRDTLFEHWYEPGDGNAHGNLYEESGSSSRLQHAYYNNLFRTICTDSNSCPNGIVGVWPQPDLSTTDYFFGNIFYSDNTGGNYFDIGQNGSSQGSIVLLNNTFELPSGTNAFLQCNASSVHPFVAANNLYIGETTSAYSSPCTGGVFVTELLMNHATASANGLTASETFAYSPPSQAGPTVGIGTNEGTINNAYCTALSTAATLIPALADAAGACQSDSRYACTYDSTKHGVNCPARAVVARPTGNWDVGAYQAGAAQTTPPGSTGTLTSQIR